MDNKKTDKLVLFVMIKGTVNEAGKNKIEGRLNLRDMTVQYWPLSGETASRVVRVCGVYGDTIFSSFPVKQNADGGSMFDTANYPCHGKELTSKDRVFFFCDDYDETYVGLHLPKGKGWPSPRWAYKTMLVEEFDQYYMNLIEKTDHIKEREKVIERISKLGIDTDGDLNKYDDGKDYSQPKYGYERDLSLIRKAKKQANYKCEVYSSNRQMDCPYCNCCPYKEMDSEDVSIVGHHIDELHFNPDSNDKLDNLIVICSKFHHAYHKEYCNDERASEIIKLFKECRYQS